MTKQRTYQCIYLTTSLAAATADYATLRIIETGRKFNLNSIILTLLLSDDLTGLQIPNNNTGKYKWTIVPSNVLGSTAWKLLKAGGLGNVDQNCGFFDVGQYWFDCYPINEILEIQVNLNNQTANPVTSYVGIVCNIEFIDY